MLKQLLIFTLFMLGMAGICHAQVERNFGALNSSEISKTPGAIKATYYSGSGIKVMYHDNGGIFRDTSVASLLQDAVKYADTGVLVPSLYQINTAVAAKQDTAIGGVYVYSRDQLKQAIGYSTKIIIASDTITTDTILYPLTGTTIQGLGRGKSKITAATDNTYGIFSVLSVNNVTIKDLELAGEGSNVDPTSATGSFYTTLGIAADSNIGTSRGILVNNVQRVFITNVYVHNFTKAGIEVQNTGVTESARMGLTVDNVYLTNNYYGLYCGNSGQYNTFSNIESNYNICGFGKRAGNITVTGSHITNNRVGYFSGFGSNAAHGSISNSLINHSYLRAIYISNITSGEIVTGCHVYDAGIEVVASAGVQIDNNLLECAVTVDGVGTNTVHDNILSLESGGGNITNTGVGAFYMYNNNSIPDRNNRTVNNNIITRLRAASSTEVEPVEYVATGATTGFWDFRYPLVSLSGGILVNASFEGDLYGTPGTSFKLDVRVYPNTISAIAPTAYIMATFNNVNGTLPFTKVSAAIAPDGQLSIRIGDTNTAVPVSRLAMTKCTFWNVGNQGNQLNYTGGKWTARITNTNVGFTSAQTITPKTNLNDASAINGANITAATVTPAKLSYTSTRSSAGTLTVAYGNDYTFTGTTSTWTLPAIAAGTTGRQNAIFIKNAGSGTITLNTNASANVLYYTSLTNTLSVLAGESYIITPDGTQLNVYKCN